MALRISSGGAWALGASLSRRVERGATANAARKRTTSLNWKRRHVRGCHKESATGEAHAGSTQTKPELDLMTPFQLGPFKLSHRVVMAPLTRCRSYDTMPQPHAVIYYGQRANPGGLLISEATVISETGHGYVATPGIYTSEHVEAWKPIVKAVHDKGAVFVMQLWHAGRVSHVSYQPNGGKPISSTNRSIKIGEILIADGSMQPYSEPKALTRDEIGEVVNDFVKAARNAIAAGFDAVEIHGAHGYLLEQFSKSMVNDRTDEYGGSLENRARFTLEIVDAVAAAVGRERVGIRLSPFASDLGDAKDADPFGLGVYMAEELSKREILYLHFVTPRYDVFGEKESEHTLRPFKEAFQGPFLGAGCLTKETADEAVRSGEVDLTVFGRLFLANPDLVERFKLDAPLNPYHRETFYTQDPVVGYTDYPYLEESHPDFVRSRL